MRVALAIILCGALIVVVVANLKGRERVFLCAGAVIALSGGFFACLGIVEREWTTVLLNGSIAVGWVSVIGMRLYVRRLVRLRVESEAEWERRWTQMWEEYKTELQKTIDDTEKGLDNQ